MHGWIILDKPVGLGSTQAVSAVKRALREGGYPRLKVGHGGTLDPLASGVLPVAVGEATKLAGRMLDSDKVYAFTILFGEETDTLDAEGAVVATSAVRPTSDAIEAALPRFTGTIEQVPPAYSALKVDGKRAYDLARAGEAVTLATRTVVIHELTRHPGLVPGSTAPQTAALAEKWMPEQVRHDGTA
jgi:tRNA pseudouridine55 synthase